MIPFKNRTEKILLADDEMTFRETLARFLRDESLDVTTVDNGLDAIEAARETAFHVVILDVRTDDETEAGKIAGAIAIPAEEVVERLDEIPKDKQVYIHCSTGIRAEMAYVALKEKGYKASFLDANIEVSDSGSYEITDHITGVGL